jgi:class 3 adenylate cyclase
LNPIARAAAKLVAAAIRIAESHGMVALSRRAEGLRDSPVPPHEPTSGRRLATIMFFDMVDSTRRAVATGDHKWKKILDSYYDTIRAQLTAFGGREINTFGDAFFALFDYPLSAVRCAWLIRERISELGLEVRAGLHTGECEFNEDKVTGIAIHIGARVVHSAGPGEVLVSKHGERCGSSRENRVRRSRRVCSRACPVSGVSLR